MTRRMVARLRLALAAVIVAAATPGFGEEVSSSSAGSTNHSDWGEDESLVWDPIEPFNRRIFAFNETLDHWIFEPVATGWNFVLPVRARLCVDNFFSNLALPVRFANDVLQLKLIHAVEDTGRLVTNTIVGVGGLFDPASRFGIPRHDEDFGQTLGYWGVPAGFYLVIPILGPSNPRDGVGIAVDSFGAVQTFFLSFPILASAAAVSAVNDRSLTLEQVRAERASAFDFYAAVRTGYSQYRDARIRDQEVESDPEQVDDDLYYFDEEEDYEDD